MDNKPFRALATRLSQFVQLRGFLGHLHVGDGAVHMDGHRSGARRRSVRLRD